MSEQTEVSRPAVRLTEQQQEIKEAAERLLEVLDRVIPSNVAHYAVTDLQDRHLPILIRKVGTIHTSDWQPTANQRRRECDSPPIE